MTDFSNAIRPVFFQTEYEEWLYATHGGTLFLVAYKGQPYAITCGHVFKDFDRGHQFIPQDKIARKGSPPAHISGYAYPSSPRDGAVGTDIGDLCVITFSEDTTPDFFTGIYQINDTTAGSSERGQRLVVAGVLKEKSRIDPPDLWFGYCRLEFQDMGPQEDPFMRRGFAQFLQPEFTEITGVSGSPVFNLTANRLCGMVLRGGMNGNFCNVYFMDAADIMRFLEAVSSKAGSVYYSKDPPR